ncbi:TetR/AcrR family transcriptional regulator [Nonomuraea dietziae]|uniref:TetR/AcrR family transcriptional regulator n=1 Tax=Nonomuraea dietziae TaxID=65515 RepID=UPI0036161CBD
MPPLTRYYEQKTNLFIWRYDATGVLRSGAGADHRAAARHRDPPVLHAGPAQDLPRRADHPAGIAKTSFYAFFTCKEDLYFEAALRQNEEVRRRVIGEGLHQGADTRDALRRFLRATVRELDTNPLYRRLMSHPDEMEAVAARLTPERMAAAEGGPMADLVAFLGERLDGDPHVLLGVLRAVLLTPLHAGHLGADLYPTVMERLIDAVTEGLTS